MIKNIKSILCCLILSFMIISSMNPVEAASFSVTASVSTVSPNGTFKVNIKASDCIGRVNISVSNGTISGEKSVWVENNTVSVTVKASSSGDVKVTASPEAGFSDGDGNPYNPGAKSVTVKLKTNTGSNTGGNTTTVSKSKDNNLSSLTVSTGSLSPTFKSSTTSYIVNLDGNATKITLSAKANHSKAKVSGTGEKTLKVGNNAFTIKCTAENGSVKNYKVNVYVDETPLIYTTYKDKRMGVVRNTDGIGVPATFEAKTITLEGQEVKGYYSAQFDKTIVYLSDENNVKSFYVYEDNKGIVSIFKHMSILGRNLYIVDLTEEETVREDMTYQEIEIDGQKLMGWVYNNPAYANYKLLTAMNEFGEMVVYQHEKTENSLQLYLKEVPIVNEPVEEPEEKESFETLFMVSTGFFICTTIIMFVIHLRFKKKTVASIKAYYEKRNQE